MAIRALNSVVVANYDVAATASWQAGACLMRDRNTNLVGLAIRSGAACSSPFLGFSADDTARTGNTMILADPVGSSYVDNSNVLQAANNGFYTVAKRAIGDFQSEIVNGVTNPSAQTSGFEGPRRGVGVYNTPGGQFVTDFFKTAASGSSVSAIFDDGNTASYYPGAPLTFAADGSGKIVEAARSTNPAAAAGTIASDIVSGYGGTLPKALVGFVDRYDSAAGLLYFTQA